MRKLCLTVCCILISALILAGCGDQYADSPYVGTWSASSCEYSGMTFDVEELLGGDFTITLNADGSVDASVIGEEESGTWKPTDSGVTVKDSSDKMKFTDEDGVLVLDFSGVTVSFEKQ